MKNIQLRTSYLMVRPQVFHQNEQTLKSNSFQKERPSEDMTEQAQKEFDHVLKQLQAKEINVFSFEDNKCLPDAVFPNNWISFHQTKHENLAILYPMEALNRRAERRKDIIEEISKVHKIDSVIDLSHYEKEGLFLEGTGSMVFDYEHSFIYACRSSRTSQKIIKEVAEILDYRYTLFSAYDEQVQSIYHTNVMMSLADKYAILCKTSIEKEECSLVLDTIESTNREIIEINSEQMQHFAGNMLQVYSKSGDKYLVMSTTAYRSLSDFQLDRLAQYNRLLPIDVSTIEQYGGGSIRCMLAVIPLG